MILIHTIFISYILLGLGYCLMKMNYASVLIQKTRRRGKGERVGGREGGKREGWRGLKMESKEEGKGDRVRIEGEGKRVRI